MVTSNSFHSIHSAFLGLTSGVMQTWLNYSDESWRLLVDLWCAYNLHLAHVVANIPPEKMSIPCEIGEDDSMSLEKVIAEYIRHMEHHLKQLNGFTD